VPAARAHVGGRGGRRGAERDMLGSPCTTGPTGNQCTGFCEHPDGGTSGKCAARCGSG